MNESEHFESSSNFDSTPIRTTANVLWGLTAIIGIPANIFVLAAIVYFRDMRTISNIYIFNLAVADLIFLLSVPILFSQPNGDWTLGVAMCKAYFSSYTASQFASAVFIAILSFDRFLAVCRPLTSSSLRTPQAAFFLSVTAWVMVILETVPLMMFVTVVSADRGDDTIERKCTPYFGDNNKNDYRGSSDNLEIIEQNLIMSRRFFVSYTFALSYLIPLIAVWFFYTKIILRMCQRRRQMYLKRASTRKKTTKVTIMGLAIVISYTLCLLPFWIATWFIELNLFRGNEVALIGVSLFGFCLQYINSAANPFLYVFLSDSFKKNIAKLIHSERSEKSITGNQDQTDSTKLLITRSKDSSFVSHQPQHVL